MAPSILIDLQGQPPTSQPRETEFLPSPFSLDFRSVKDDQHETKLQECWDKSIAENLNLRDGYHNIHVLMIKWRDEIDQLCVRQEVDDLTYVFKEVFKYDVDEIQLGASKSQLELESKITSWAFKNDSSENLLIIYYAGHGMFNDMTRVLEFTPTNEIDAGPRVIWNKAEKPFVETVQADVFAIMDCCYASDLLRNVPETGRTFEMLAASQIGQPTIQPGEKSFTRCLIKHLTELALEHSENFFTTRDIHERMQKERTERAPALWRRIPGNDRHIRLSKLKPMHERPTRNRDMSSHARYLRLGFELKHDLFHETHIESLTKRLPGVFKEVGLPLLDIRWLGCRKVGNRTFRDVAEWVIKNREDLAAISPEPTERKRSSDDSSVDENNADNTKRRDIHKRPRLRMKTSG